MHVCAGGNIETEFPMCDAEQCLRPGVVYARAGWLALEKTKAQNMVHRSGPKGNLLLAALPDADYRRVLPHLVERALVIDETLFRPGTQPKIAYFPTNSIVTLSYAIEGRKVVAKAWPVGREGIVGISLFLGSVCPDNRAEVQVGGPAFGISASALMTEFRRAGALQRVLLRYVFALVTQASQLSVCNQHHSAEQRLCRFLSRGFDRMDGSVLSVTQARIAMILGVRRESVNESATRLQNASIIKYCRGQVTLVDRGKLEDRACDCAEIIRRAFAAVTAK
jgi:hypothetical protein